MLKSAAGGPQGGRSVHKGGVAGFESGEGPSAGVATRHRVTIHNHHAGQVVEVDVPEDRSAPSISPPHLRVQALAQLHEEPWACQAGFASGKLMAMQLSPNTIAAVQGLLLVMIWQQREEG